MVEYVGLLVPRRCRGARMGLVVNLVGRRRDGRRVLQSRVGGLESVGRECRGLESSGVVE